MQICSRLLSMFLKQVVEWCNENSSFYEGMVRSANANAWKR
jgi:hypothetical protein